LRASKTEEPLRAPSLYRGIIDVVPAMRPDNRIIAHQNELAVLKYLGLFAHLRYIEVGRAVWPHSTWKVAQQMAERTVARLIKDKALFQTRNKLGSYSILLTKSGVDRCRHLDMKAAHNTPDLFGVHGTQFAHRSYESRYLVERTAQGHHAFGSHAIAKSWAPINRQQSIDQHQKIPDGLVLVPGIERGYTSNEIQIADWIEVENSRKPYTELWSILDIAWKIGKFLDKAETVLLDRVVFVYDGAEPHRKRILNAVERYMRSHPTNNPALLSSIILCECRVSLPFIWHGHEEIPCSALIEAPLH